MSTREGMCRSHMPLGGSPHLTFCESKAEGYFDPSVIGPFWKGDRNSFQYEIFWCSCTVCRHLSAVGTPHRASQYPFCNFSVQLHCVVCTCSYSPPTCWTITLGTCLDLSTFAMRNWIFISVGNPRMHSHIQRYHRIMSLDFGQF